LSINEDMPEIKNKKYKNEYAYRSKMNFQRFWEIDF